MLKQAIDSFLKSAPLGKLYLIDNSPTDRLKHLANDVRIVYIFNKKNIGFGAAHNICIRSIINESKYHLVLNPDVHFASDVIEKLYNFLEANPDVGQVMPKVFYPDGRLQYSCKLLPTPRTMAVRRFFTFSKASLERVNYYYELKFFGYDKIVDVPFLAGCFMFLKTEALKKVGLFDERFFMYTEDTDLTRRIRKHYRTVYYPETSIYHHHQQGSYKNFWLLMINVQSAIRYFNKWGWFFDPEREEINQRTVLRLTT